MTALAGGSTRDRPCSGLTSAPVASSVGLSTTQARYEHGWVFRREWVRDGIPWFVFPPERMTASTQTYSQMKLAYVRRRLRGTSKAAYLDDVLEHVVPGNASGQAQIEAIIGFVQGAMWHNPLECPFEADGETIVTEAHELLELHDGRCWHTAEVLRQLFERAGWPARLRRLPSDRRDDHVVTEVLFDGVWRMTDANYFAEGTVLTHPDGSLPTLTWLRQHPRHADAFAGGWVYPRVFMTNEAGIPVTGQFVVPFPEAEDTWGYDPYYSFYLGAPKRFPPMTPPALTVERCHALGVSVRWGVSRGHTSHRVRYDVEVRTVAGDRLIAEQRGLVDRSVVIDGLEADALHVVRVRATDEQLERNPSTWYPWRRAEFRPAELDTRGTRSTARVLAAESG